MVSLIIAKETRGLGILSWVQSTLRNITRFGYFQLQALLFENQVDAYTYMNVEIYNCSQSTENFNVILLIKLG